MAWGAVLTQWYVAAATAYTILSLALGQELDEPYTDADEDRLKSFWDTRVEVDPCCDVILGEPLEITVWFRTDGNFTESVALYVDLPRECIE
ncbi:unnamed protein product [Ectocarpus sp. 13 AM-2016]